MRAADRWDETRERSPPHSHTGDPRNSHCTSTSRDARCESREAKRVLKKQEPILKMKFKWVSTPRVLARS